VKFQKAVKMTLLPVLLDMVDEIYQNLDNPQKNFSDIPLLFVPQGTRNNSCARKCPRLSQDLKGCPYKLQQLQQQHCQRQKVGMKDGCPCKPKSVDDFCVMLNVKSYKPEEISVKVKGHEVIVEGKHDEREDEFGFVSRQFTRRYIMPDDIDVDTVATYLDAEGIMTIKANKPKSAIEANERVIPIQRVPSTIETSDKSDDSQNDKEEATTSAASKLEDSFEKIEKKDEE
jgi:hypothetical protein